MYFVVTQDIISEQGPLYSNLVDDEMYAMPLLSFKSYFYMTDLSSSFEDVVLEGG